MIQLQLVPVVRGKHAKRPRAFQPSTRACSGLPTSPDPRKARRRARQGHAGGVPVVLPAVLQVYKGDLAAALRASARARHLLVVVLVAVAPGVAAMRREAAVLALRALAGKRAGAAR